MEQTDKTEQNIEQNTEQKAEQTQVVAAGVSQPNADEIAQALFRAFDRSQQRNVRSISRSFAEEYGMTQQEVETILQKERDRRAAQPTPQQQAILDRANRALVRAQVMNDGAKLGLLDADAALKLMDFSRVSVAEDGTVRGVEDALGALKTQKAYLFGGAKQQEATGLSHGDAQQSGPDEARLRRDLGLSPKR